MFKVEDVYVDDRKLGDLLKAIAGIAIGHPRPVPVINAEPHKGVVKAKGNGSNMVEVFTEYLAADKIETFRPADVRAWLAKNGRSKLSANYIMKGLLKSHMVKRTGKSSATTYHVQRPKA